MSLFKRLVTRMRLRGAERALAADPSARNYVALAREHVIAGQIDDVLGVCMEGLELHAGDAELKRLAERARALQLEKRLRVLQRQVAASPRPALWRELCELNLEAGRLPKAREAASAWLESDQDAEALYFLARVHQATFLSERRAADGLRAFELAGQAHEQLRNDPRPLHLQVEIAARAGAWQDARRCLARLLELLPGDPELEGRFRKILAMSEDARGLERALADVERSGRFVEDEPEVARPAADMAVRPMLQQLSADHEVRAAVYVRGGTALVQGPRGATADRTARAVREMVLASRHATRRMRLGQPLEVLLEGEFGSLLLSPGEQGASAVWCVGAVKRRHEELLKELSGMAGASWSASA